MYRVLQEPDSRDGKTSGQVGSGRVGSDRIGSSRAGSSRVPENFLVSREFPSFPRMSGFSDGV